MIKLNKLTKVYRTDEVESTALNEVSFEIQKGELDKKFKPLYAFGTDDFSSVKTFMKQTTGEPVRVVKRPFKVVFGIEDKSDAKEV